MKNIIISVAGAEGKREFKDVQILPGTKPRDVLAQLNLNGFQLSKPEGGAFGFNDDLYQAVADGQKVFATKADVEAGDYSFSNPASVMAFQFLSFANCSSQLG